MPRSPYDVHLCAQDPAAFEAGFDFASFWVDHLCLAGQPETIYQIVKNSTGVPYPETAAKAGFPPSDARGEGFMLGVYGYLALHQR